MLHCAALRRSVSSSFTSAFLRRSAHSGSSSALVEHGWFVSEQPEEAILSHWSIFAGRPDIHWWDGKLHAEVRHFADENARTFRLERKLGFGGGSNVWLATNKQNGKYVVLKILNNNHSYAVNSMDNNFQEFQVMNHLFFGHTPFHRLACPALSEDASAEAAHGGVAVNGQNDGPHDLPPTESSTAVPPMPCNNSSSPDPETTIDGGAETQSHSLPDRLKPSSDLDHPGRSHIRTYTGGFCIWEDQSDPTKEHVAFVLEPLSHSLHEWTGMRCARGVNGFPLDWVKRIVRQTLLALSFLHGQGIIHGDVQGANILLVPQGNIQQLIHRLCLGDPAPQFQADGLSVKQRPLQFPLPQTAEDIHVKLIDFGGSQWEDLVHEHDWTNPGTFIYNPPEKLLGGTISPAADVWSLGCTIFGLLTSHHLFTRSYPPEGAKWTMEHDFLMRQAMLAGAGLEWPKSLTRLDGARAYIHEDGLLNHIRMRKPYKIETVIRHCAPTMTESDVGAAATFIRRCITLDPDIRPAANALLEDPWLQ